MRNKNVIGYLMGGVCALFCVALVIWLVRSEGERAREAIRESTQEVSGEVREGMIDAAERAVDKAADVPGKVIRDVKDELSEGVAETAEQAVDTLGELAGTVFGDRDKKKPDESSAASGEQPPAAAPGQHDQPATNTPGTTTPEPTPDSASTNTSQPRSSNPNVSRPQADSTSKEGEDSQDPGDIVGRLFEMGHEVARSIDDIGQEALALSEDEEREVGADVHELVLEQHKRLAAPKLVKRLEVIARPLLLDRKRKEIKYTITILDDETVNAFAHVGGYIYVNKGLLQLVADDAELQFVLGHEIGHVDLKHCTRAVTYAARASDVGGELGGGLAQLAYIAIALGYSEDQEFEADEHGCHAMQRIGQNGQPAVRCLQRLAKHFDEEPSHTEADESRTAAQRTVEEIEEHFRSHPPTQERVERLEALLRQPAPR